MNGWTILYRGSCVILAVFAVAGLFHVFWPRTLQYREFRQRQSVLEQSIREEEQHAAQLKRLQELLQTDRSFAERTAHDLGLARTNQVLFQIMGEESPSEDGPLN